MFTLYYSPGACSMACHIVLEETGLPYEAEVVSSAGPRAGSMTGTPAWHAINPKGRVPALAGVPGRIGGADNLLTEAPAILLYLARIASQVGLLPADPAAEARCIEWMNWLSGSVHAMTYGQLWRAHRFSDDEAALPAIRARGMAALTEQYGYIESLLGDGRDWAMPGGYTVVDPYLLVFYHWGGRVGLAMPEACPAWTALSRRVAARPAVGCVLQKEGIAIAGL